MLCSGDLWASRLPQRLNEYRDREGDRAIPLIDEKDGVDSKGY